MVCRDHGPRAGHILDDESRIAGNILCHMLADQARPSVVHVAVWKAGHDPDGFPLKKRRLSLNGNGTKEKQNYH
jgi:hypothetical protein